MSSSGGDGSRRAALVKGLVLKDRDVEQIILQSVTQMVWLEFMCPDSRAQTCNCSPEHESFKYMRNGQVIDMAMFEKIWKSIENGHCPHIQRGTNKNKQISTFLPSEIHDKHHWHLVPRFSHHHSQCYAQLPQCYEREIETRYLMDTKVSLLEVAAAVGNHNVLPHLLLLAGKLLRENICSWEIAARQKHTDVLQLLMSNDAPFGMALRANVHNPYQERKLRQFILGRLMYLVTEDCTEGLRMLLCIYGKMEYKPVLDKLVVSAVLYNNPELLNELSNYVTIDSNILMSDDFHVSTWQLAALLGYHGCAAEIQKHSTENQERIIELNHEALINVIILVLKIDEMEYSYRYVSRSHMAAEALKCLSMTTSIPADINVLQEIWKHILLRCDAKVFSVMLENIGCDVDMPISLSNRPRSSFLCQYLSHKTLYFDKHARQIVKTILKYNPSPDLHASDIINNALKFDIMIHHASALFNGLETYQLMKALPTDKFALRALITDPRFNEMIFLVPVLFQHGFALDTSIVEATSRDHMLLRLLYQSIVSTPRTLMSRARIVLRQSYTGRRIHEFVNQTRLPVPIKEYIFMTVELNRFCAS